MNINIKYLIIGGVVLLILIATHRNPAEERHKAALAEKASHPDPLVYSIEKHNQKKSGLRGAVNSITNAVPGNPTTSGTIGTPGAPGSAPGNPYQNPATSSYYNNYNYSGTKSSTGYNQQYYGEPAPTNNNQNTQQNNGYYPPPPVNNNSGNSGAVMPPPYAPRSMNATTTDDGQRLAFSGTFVYKVDNGGKWSPMPDGNYKTANGAPLVVRGGKKIIITN